MAAPDDTALKALINSNIPDANPGLPRRATAAFVRAVLFSLIDWVKTGINGNLSTWLRTADNQPGGSNADAIYRTGAMTLKGGMTSVVTSASGAHLDAVGVGQSGLQIMGNGNGSAAFMEFHIPGVMINQLGVDFDGLLKYRLLGGSPLEVVISGLSSVLTLASLVANKRIVLFDNSNNQHQFYGFGISAQTLRYQVADTTAMHAFFAGTSPATSTELFRIQGDGLVDGAKAIRAKGTSTPASGAGVEIHYGAVPNSGSLISYDRTASTYRDMIIDGMNVIVNSGNPAAGRMGVSTTAPTSALHVKGPTGHQQLRLETAYTPTGSADANGAVGQIAWSDTYFYVKTVAGWKRSALTTF